MAIHLVKNATVYGQVEGICISPIPICHIWKIVSASLWKVLKVQGSCSESCFSKYKSSRVYVMGNLFR